MALNTGFRGKGVVFKMGDGESPEVFTAVANASAINVNGRSVDEVDFTHLNTTGRYKELKAGFIDPGNVGLTLHFDPAHTTHTEVETLLNSGDNFNWQVDFSGAGKAFKLSGTGYVSAADISVTVNDPVGYDITIRNSGALAITAVV